MVGFTGGALLMWCLESITNGIVVPLSGRVSGKVIVVIVGLCLVPEYWDAFCCRVLWGRWALQGHALPKIFLRGMVIRV